MILRYTSPAMREVDEAFEWYKARNPEAAYHFMDALDLTAQRVIRYPHIAPENADGIRRPTFMVSRMHSVTRSRTTRSWCMPLATRAAAPITSMKD